MADERGHLIGGQGQPEEAHCLVVACHRLLRGGKDARPPLRIAASRSIMRMLSCG
jgi:hypothetical protein